MPLLEFGPQIKDVRARPAAASGGVPTVSPSPAPVDIPDEEMFRDDWDRTISRSVERNSIGDPASDKEIAWDLATDGSQWLVNQIDESDTDGVTGGAGVSSGTSFRHHDFGSDSTFDATVSVPEMDTEGEWVFEFSFRMVRDGFVTTLTHAAEYDFNMGGALSVLNIWLEWRSQAEFASELTLSETNTTIRYYHMSWDAWYNVKWVHSVAADVAKVRIWLQGDTEPTSWLIGDTPYDFQGEPASDEFSITEVTTTGITAAADDDYVGIELGPMTIKRLGVTTGMYY